MYTLDSMYEYLVDIILNAEKLNTLTASKIKNKDTHFYHLLSTLYWFLSWSQ